MLIGCHFLSPVNDRVHFSILDVLVPLRYLASIGLFHPPLSFSNIAVRFILNNRASSRPMAKSFSTIS